MLESDSPALCSHGISDASVSELDSLMGLTPRRAGCRGGRCAAWRGAGAGGGARGGSVSRCAVGRPGRGSLAGTPRRGYRAFPGSAVAHGSLADHFLLVRRRGRLLWRTEKQRPARVSHLQAAGVAERGPPPPALVAEAAIRQMPEPNGEQEFGGVGSWGVGLAAAVPPGGHEGAEKAREPGLSAVCAEGGQGQAGAGGPGVFPALGSPAWSALTTLPRPPACFSSESPLVTLPQAPSHRTPQIPSPPDWDQDLMAGPVRWGEGSADFATLGAQGAWTWAQPCGQSRGRGTEAKARDGGWAAWPRQPPLED